MHIRNYQADDWEQVWPMIETVFRAGETFPVSPQISEADAKAYWIDTPQYTFVACDDDNILLGSYYIKPNQPGLGSHVCNCGYIVAEQARGRGVAIAMCEHSQQQAVSLGYRAMQYNLVVSTNVKAIHLWKKMGFQQVGVLPRAFRSQSAGYVDALVMYKQLVSD